MNSFEQVAGSPAPQTAGLPARPRLLSPADCIRCGACLAVCPLYRLLGRETAVARGKLNLLAAYQEGSLPSGKLLREVLERCLLCGACGDQCSLSLPVPELVKSGRALIRDREGAKWSPALILARLTWQASHLIPAAAPLAPWVNLLKAWVGEESGLIFRLFPQLATAWRRFPNLNRRPFRARAPRVLPGRGPLKVALFVGCGVEALFPQVGEAFLSICQRLEIEVIIPGSQGCCGLLSASVGELTLARDLAKRFLQEFAPLSADYIVTPCASCSYQLKRLGQVLADGPEGEVAGRVAARVKEASEFLVLAAARPLPGKGRLLGKAYAFHDPCHLHRGQGIVQEPRELLRGATGEPPREAEERVCCGLGGAFGALYPEVSGKLGAARFQALRAGGAGALVTSCSGCLVQLTGAAGDFPVRHLLEVLADA